MKKILFTILLAIGAFANSLTIGDSIPNLTINDQFEKVHTIKADTKTILFSATKAESETIKVFLESKDKGFLEKNNIQYIADITGMPSIISKFFALPKMKKYDFSILLIDEKNKDLFSVKEEKITVYTFKDSKVSDVKYISTKEELENLFK